MEIRVQGREPASVETHVVVQLRCLPGGAVFRPQRRIRRRFERLDGDAVALDVIGMRVAAAFVVGGHHVRAEVADHLDQPSRGHCDVLQGETALWQRRRGIALGQAGIDETQPHLLDPQDLAGAGHLGCPDGGQILEDLGIIGQGRIENVATFATTRSEERRVGKECRSRWSPYH